MILQRFLCLARLELKLQLSTTHKLQSSNPLKMIVQSYKLNIIKSSIHFLLLSALSSADRVDAATTADIVAARKP